MVTIEELQAQIQVVAKTRAAAFEVRRDKETAYAEWSEAHQDLINADLIRRDTVTKEEAKLKEMTLRAYAETGNKAPAPGVGIREITKLEYDSKVALIWATDHRMALKLDTSAFEKIAKASPLEFVTLRGEAQATIATVLEVQ